MIVTPKESKLLGFCKRSSFVDDNFDVPGVFAFAAGMIPVLLAAFVDEDVMGTEDEGTDGAPSLPRERKVSSLMGTEVDLR